MITTIGFATAEEYLKAVEAGFSAGRRRPAEKGDNSGLFGDESMEMAMLTSRLAAKLEANLTPEQMQEITPEMFDLVRDLVQDQSPGLGPGSRPSPGHL